MNSLRSSLAAIAACGLLFSAVSALAVAPKDYQITGNISEITDTTITLTTLKKEIWGFARDTTTKAPDGLKLGDKVTVHYTMTAGNIEAKPDTGAKDKKTAKTSAAADAATPKP